MPANVPIVGTTATANDRVINDAKRQLGEVRVQRGALMRESLHLQTVRLATQAERLAWLAEHIDELPGTGIIYALTQRDAEQVSAWLNEPGVLVRPYHASVVHELYEDSNAYRRRLERALDRNEVKALVATTALGMGYDKPDLGFVVHYQAPGSIIAYYQQVGRAGRGIDRAVGVVLSGVEDGEIHEYFRRTAFPNEQWVSDVLGVLESAEGLTIGELEQALNLRYGQIEKVLKVLSVDNPAPVIRDGTKWRRTAVPYRIDTERVDRLTAQREEEWRQVQSYVDEPGCLMRFLAEALDDPEPKPCGKCAPCTGSPIIDTSISHEAVVAATRFLRHAEMPLTCNKQVARGSFPEYGWSGNLPVALRAETGRVLSRWGDAGWGEVVERDKHAGRFGDELVRAAAEMIRDRWRPDPRPDWVTCVPSNRHSMLVPDYARRLATALSLPFVPVVVKARDNAPQKAQQNRFHQCHNLDGAFVVESRVQGVPSCWLTTSWTPSGRSRSLRRCSDEPAVRRCCRSHSPQRARGADVEVTRETEAVMLLNVSFGKSGAATAKPLTPTEWGEFAGWLKDRALGPADLLNCNLADVLEHWEHPKLTVRRVQALLNRGAALGFALEKWQRAGLWVVTRSDADYPGRLKQRLQRTAPAMMFGCGNRDLLDASSIAVVGSRHARDADIHFAERIGRRAAECGELVVSGGAAGVDHAAMFGALHGEGTAVGVLAENLLRAATSTKYRKHLMSGDLALVSPFNPEARFVVGNAMARNKYVYCLAHDAIVVSSTPDSGGTWKGAVENLKKGWVPLSVKRTEAVDSGNPKLVELGGRWLQGLDDPVFGTNPQGGDSTCTSSQPDATTRESLGAGQAGLSTEGEHVGDSARSRSSVAEPMTTRSHETEKRAAEESTAPAEDLYRKVRSLVAALCVEPKQATAIADALGVTKPTADAWVRRLLEERVLKKVSKPVRYVTCEKDLLEMIEGPCADH